LVVTAITTRGTAIVVVIAIAWRRSAMAVAIHEAAPARGTVAARTIVIARWAVVAAEFAAFVSIAWGRTIGATEAATGAITLAEARPFHIAFDETAF
jgi:hypothetical protein